MFWIAFFAAPALAGPDIFGFGNGTAGVVTVSEPQVVNLYQPVSAPSLPGASELTVADSSDFPVGTLILVHQTAGGTASTSFVQPPPQVDYSQMEVGQYELARVLAESGGSITVNRPLLHGYRPGGQVVRVPEYAALTVEAAGSLQALPWDGDVGGIVVVAVDGPLALDGAIDVSGMGFRGGDTDSSPTYQGVCPATSDDPDEAAFKGEGVAGFGSIGRGTLGNGGGGANCGNAGGGGGGNAGFGGRGGLAFESDGSDDRGGYGGGFALPPYDSHALFGGGGGGSDADQHPNSSRGAPGGGLVMVRARSVEGAGAFRANGANGINNIDDGASGGGAGGTVVVRVLDSLACGSAEAAGGRGGNVTDGVLNPGLGHGPGGGGGGGRVAFEAVTVACVATFGPGSGGVFSGTDAYGAQSGGLGEALELDPTLVDLDGDGVVSGPGGGPDCDDDDAASFPGADEVCDGRDNSCDGTRDEGLATSTVYADLDGDGFGDAGNSAELCGPVSGYVEDATDCDDDDPDAYPGAEEVVLDGIDQDCNGEDRTDFEDTDTDPPDTDPPDTDEEDGRASTGCDCDSGATGDLVWPGWLSRRR